MKTRPSNRPAPQGGGPIWQLAVVVPADHAALFETAIEPEAAALSFFEVVPDGPWRLQALFRGPPEPGPLEARIALAAEAAGIPAPSIELALLADQDWVAKSLEGLPPVRAGRFHLRGSHHDDPPPAGALSLLIDAGQAFGTGQHATTRGCLLALDVLMKRRRFRRPLDLGTGTGVLALAMARAWRVPVAAADIDPRAVAEARANARRNDAAGWLRTVCADGLADRGLRGGGPYDLIVANILARPLMRMALAIRRRTAPNGMVVLSGLLKSQERQVLGTYRSLGFRLDRRIVLDDWPTLILASGRR